MSTLLEIVDNTWNLKISIVRGVCTICGGPAIAAVAAAAAAVADFAPFFDENFLPFLGIFKR